MTRSETPAAGPASRRIVVAGGGAGGLELAARLAGARIPGAEVLLIDRRPTHVWKPRLHEVAVGSIARDELVYREHAHRHGYGFLPGYRQPLSNTMPLYMQKEALRGMPRHGRHPWYIYPTPQYYGWDGDWHYFGRPGFYRGQ